MSEDGFGLIKEIVKNKRLIIIVALIVATITIIYQLYTPMAYESTVSFFVDNNESQNTKANEGDLNTITYSDANGDRLYHMAKSTEMIDHLVKKFNLYYHFGIDSNSAMHYEMLNVTMQSNIRVRITEHNSISITVTDNDKMMAAKIANEIFMKLDIMTKDLIISTAEKKIKIYDQLLRDMKKQSFSQTEEFKKLIDGVSSLIGKQHLLNSENNLVYDLKGQLELLSLQLSSINNDLLKTIKVYEIASIALKKENLPTLRIINIALPDSNSHKALSAIFYVLGFSFIAAFITIFIIGLLYNYREPLKELKRFLV